MIVNVFPVEIFPTLKYFTENYTGSLFFHWRHSVPEYPVHCRERILAQLNLSSFKSQKHIPLWSYFPVWHLSKYSTGAITTYQQSTALRDWDRSCDISNVIWAGQSTPWEGVFCFAENAVWELKTKMID